MRKSKRDKPALSIDHTVDDEDDLSGHSATTMSDINLLSTRYAPVTEIRSNKMTAIHSQLSSQNESRESTTSLANSIDRFREDFNMLKCKMHIFGESLNLCRCMAFDFKNKMSLMEKRLRILETKHDEIQHVNNYTAIIKKNKLLSFKMKADVKRLQMATNEEEMREIAGRICKNYLYGAWKTVDPQQLECKKLTGGLSNFLYYVALPENTAYRRDEIDDKATGFSFEEPRKVLLRIYGQVHGDRAVDAIVTESVIFTLLSERRLGPKLHGVFSGGRIEEYIPARCLFVRELSEPAISMKIAEKMAAIHSMDVPLSKEPSWLWKTAGKWVKTIKEERLTANAAGKDEKEMSIIRRLKVIEFDKEIEWLKKYLATVDSPVVFCHNDLQEGNILYLEDVSQTETDDFVSAFTSTYDQTGTPTNSNTILEETNKNDADFIEVLQHYEDANTSDSHISDSGEPKLVLIDFEYCAYNYRGFDIANHFQEWCYDYTEPDFPHYSENIDNAATLEQKEIFIKQYLKHYTSFSEDKDFEPTIDMVNKLLCEVEAFALASHLFWSLWAVVNAGHSQITFGYWEYALSRIEMYLRLKQEIMKGDDGMRPSKRKIHEVDI